jgi:putative ABC transport system permease protein
MKTLGFSDGKVTALVLAEALLLLVLAGGLGLTVATAILPALNRAIGSRFPPLYVTAETWLIGTLIVLALALAIGLPPALRAHRLRIVDALAGHR